MSIEKGRSGSKDVKKFDNSLTYLKASEQKAIENWCKKIYPVIERYPSLLKVDLVVEGGPGTGVTLPHILRRLFPAALYIGIDLARGMGQPFIGESTIEEIKQANQNPSMTMDDAKILGNCFDDDLVQDIMQQTNTQHPLLASYSAMNALFDKKMNPWDRKQKEDLRSVEDVVSDASPYKAQMHIGVDWDDTNFDRRYFQLEAEAQKQGWITDRWEDGLLIVRPE